MWIDKSGNLRRSSGQVAGVNVKRCADCAAPSIDGLCPACHQARTQDTVALRSAEIQVMRIKKKYGLTNEETKMKKVVNVLEKHNFNFAWGVAEGDELKKMVIAGMKRHNLKDIAPYIRHCIRETSLREQK